MVIDQNLVTAAINPTNGNNGKRITLASNAESGKPQFGDDAKSIVNKPGANAPSSPAITPILAPAVVLKPRNNTPIIAEQSLVDQKMAKTTIIEKNLITETDAKKADAKQTDIREMVINQNLVTAAINPTNGNRDNPASIAAQAQESVSYTHLTLPTILRV